MRALHDRLSEHLERVKDGNEIVVTRRGRPIARLCAVNETDPLQDLVRRGLVTPPDRPRSMRRARVQAVGPARAVITLVSWDHDLRRAATENGCAIAPAT